jgi:hypothetical protein
MRLVGDSSWKRQGFTLLWEVAALDRLRSPTEVFTVRQLFLASHSWPVELPHGDGSSLVVAGLDGVLDALTHEDAETWLAEDLRSVLFQFQAEYEGQAGLILWLPEGRARIRTSRARETYEWRCAAPSHGRTLPLGRLLWSGAEGDVGRVIAEGEGAADPDGPGWMGLHIRRVS